jgi:hypothetical protein
VYGDRRRDVRGALVGPQRRGRVRRSGPLDADGGLNQRTRDAIRRANVRLTVRITVIDGAGNRSRQTRVLRSQTLGQRRG